MLINEPEIAQSCIKVVPKLWGSEFWIVNSELYCMKFLKVIPGYRSSIHAHAIKDETFIGWSGTLRLNIHNGKGEIMDTKAIHPGQHYHLWPEVWHSFQAINESWIVEVSTQHSDRDVIRLAESMRLDGKTG
jgi:D-lyxose ketol-isomerase